MCTRYQFSPLPSLQPGETVLLFKKRVWALSTKSFPSYRFFFSLPPIVEAALYITNRRVLVLANVFRLLSQAVSQWHAGETQAASDLITRLNLDGARF
jgi:hypothetical protein